MHLLKFTVLAGLVFTAQAQISAQQVVNSINAITDLSAKTNTIAQSIGITNFFYTTPQIVDNFRQIVQLATTGISSLTKRTLVSRQDCMDPLAGAACLQNLLEILQDPGQLYGNTTGNSTSSTMSNTTSAKMVRRYVCSDPEDPVGCIKEIQALVDAEMTLPKRASEASGSISSRAIAATSSRDVNDISSRGIVVRQDVPVFPSSDQQAICNAFRGFVAVHQQLLSTIIGKHGLLSLSPFTSPIAVVLRLIEGGVDGLANGLINLAPFCASDIKQQKQSLDETLGRSLDEYDS